MRASSSEQIVHLRHENGVLGPGGVGSKERSHPRRTFFPGGSSEVKIGRRERTIIVEPIRVPVPPREDPTPEETPQPGEQPIRDPKREPAPA